MPRKAVFQPTKSHKLDARSIRRARKDKLPRSNVCFAAFPHFADQLEALHEMTRVAKKGAPVIIAHLMSRDELLKHHGNHSPVAGDNVPEAADMRHMCQSASLTDPQIIDQPGMYLLRALKR